MVPTRQALGSSLAAPLSPLAFLGEALPSAALNPPIHG
jgi:hypothetical protein